MLNVPNTITIIRIILIPLFIAVMLLDVKYSNYLAAFIFLMLAISDYIDGYMARKKNQITDAGKLLDPIADKIMVLSALFLLYEKIPLWASIVIAFREILLTAIRLCIKDEIVVPANLLGKLKTVFQIAAIMFVLLELRQSGRLSSIFQIAAIMFVLLELPFFLALVYIALAITIIS